MLRDTLASYGTAIDESISFKLSEHPQYRLAPDQPILSYMEALPWQDSSEVLGLNSIRHGLKFHREVSWSCCISIKF